MGNINKKDANKGKDNIEKDTQIKIDEYEPEEKYKKIEQELKEFKEKYQKLQDENNKNKEELSHYRKKYKEFEGLTDNCFDKLKKDCNDNIKIGYNTGKIIKDIDDYIKTLSDQKRKNIE